MKKNLIFSGLIALVISLSTVSIFSYFNNTANRTVKIEHINQTASKNALYSMDDAGNVIPLDFNTTAEKVLDAVVHIKSTQIYTNQRNSLQEIPAPLQDLFGGNLEQFFGPNPRFKTPNLNQSPTRVGTGSGVIISQDGYIVTNNHVISNADDVEVTLHDNRTYKATIVGTDPSTDLALLQIEENNLPNVPFVNSDQVKTGQWVLAVGNPMGLNSTVTAGIVSAKGRSINILKDKYAVENFIQTDAAINPGNSGGALVNLDGGLVGINTAIASPTGSFAGYGFAIPANIVSKVVQDLIEYGLVQRGVLGIMIHSIDGNFAKEKNLNLTQGVYVDSLLENSAAQKAKVQVGDVITAVDGITVKTSSDLQEIVARHRPGESVELSINRNGAEKNIAVILNNKEGDAKLLDKSSRKTIQTLGAEVENVSGALAEKLGIDGGVQVKKLYAGKLKKQTQMRDGFIITHVDGKAIDSIDELTKILDKKVGGVLLEGVYEEVPGAYYYALGM